MVKLTLTLKSRRPSTVYALNGKPYRLHPGSNTLELKYDDYVSLAKALGIKNIKENPDAKKEEPKPEVPVAEPPKVEEPTPVEETKAEEPVEEFTAEPETNEDKVEELEDKPVDYTTMTYNELKAKYKEVTGNSCRLKKDEIIAFLQEHDKDV